MKVFIPLYFQVFCGHISSSDEIHILAIEQILQDQTKKCKN